MLLLAWTVSRSFQIRHAPSLCITTAACYRNKCPPFSSLSRRSLLSVLLATIALPVQSDAVCGDPDPYFAHFTEWREDISKLPDGRRVHYRLVGSRKNETKTMKYPVVYIGDAGVGISSGETLELLGGDRRVLFTDILGVGYSEPRVTLSTSRLDLIEQACTEVRSAMKSAGFSKGTQLHVIAAGFGIEVAEALVQSLLGDGIEVLSVVAEGWEPIQGEVSFEQLQGKRICALEGAQAGNLELARSVYNDKRNRGAAGEAVKRLSEQLPTLNLQTADHATAKLQGVGPKYVEKTINGTERLAHLADTEDCLSLLDNFFVGIEQHRK